MPIKDNVTIGIDWRFGPDWLDQRCGAKTRRRTACQCPTNKKNGRRRLHGGVSIGAKTEEGLARISAANLRHRKFTKDKLEKRRKNASTRREPRSLNLKPRPTICGSRSVDHGPMCLDLGPRAMGQNCYPK